MAVRADLRLPSRIARLVAEALPAESAATQVGIVGAGGSGSGEVLAEVAERLVAVGRPVLRATGRRLERDEPLGAVADLLGPAGSAALAPPPGTGGVAGGEPSERACRDALMARLVDESAALVVDEAQWLDPASLRVVVGIAERAGDAGVTVVVAHRPAPGDAPLAALDAALSRHRALLWLGLLDEGDVAERAALVRGSAVDPAMVEALHEQSAGVQAFVDHLAKSWTSDGGRDLTAPVIEAVRAEVDQLPADARTVLAALSAGADLDDDLLGSVTGLVGVQLGDAVDALRAAGLVVSARDDAVVPVVAAAVTELTPVAERRRFHALLAAALTERGAPPTQAAEHLAAANAQGQAAADAYVAAGDANVIDAPELARAWFDRAVAVGAPHHLVAARRAEAAALDGDAVVALRLADAAVGEAGTPDRDRALSVVAALLPARGFWRRSADAYAELAQGEGARAEAARVLGAVGSVVAGRPPQGDAVGDLPPGSSLELDAMALCARGLGLSLGTDAGSVLPPFLEAAELLESSHTRLVLPDTPHAIGATVAVALSELSAAEHLLARAVERDVGGGALRQRHRLLAGWVAMRMGRWAAAQSALDEARQQAQAQSQTLAPRESLLASAIDAGLARRSGDLARLGDAWRSAEGVLLRHPADLLSLDVIGELTIAASRLGLWDRVGAKARELGDVMRALGEPPLWVLPLRWIGLQVALASDDKEAAVRRAAEVEAVAPVNARLRALAEAARAWVAILGGTVEPARVAAVSRGLQGLGLTWEASRLTGQAAIRSADPAITRSLLEQARDLKAALPSAEADEQPTTASVLSEREQMVSQYIVDGLTYKEIGAQLYISPKTVEHHVAKIRQKLGATTRAEMLAALRTQLAPT
jgi:DNA-binding NarL/FixJ family response regulator